MLLSPRAAFQVRCAFRNLWRSPHRTLFSLATMAGAVMALILFRSFNDGVGVQFREYIIRSDVGQFQINRRGFREHRAQRPYDFPLTSVEALRGELERELGPLALFGPRQDFLSMVSAGERSVPAKGIGIDAAEERKYFSVISVIEGTHLDGAPAKSILLGASLAQQLGVKVGGTVTVLASSASGSLNAYDLTVVGIFLTGLKDIDEGVYYVPYALAQSLLRVAGPATVSIALPVADERTKRDALERVVAKHGGELEVVHWHAIKGELYDAGMGWLEGIFRFIRLVLLLVISLALVNIFTVSILERLGEFGTLRALGTQRRELLTLVLIESLLQAALGAALGLLGSQFVILTLLRSGLDMPPPTGMSVPFHVRFAMPWADTVEVLALCMAVAAIAGFLPALRLTRVNVARALGGNV